MSNKIIPFKANEEIQELLERLGKELMSDNTSHIIRYAIKYTAKELLEKKT